MRVALCQIAIQTDSAANQRTVEEAMEQCASADVAVFPEGTSTSFGPGLASRAQSLDGPFAETLRREARRRGVAVLAGMFETAPRGRVYNTVLAVDSGGRLAGAYRKIHLFDAFSHRESELVAPGTTPEVVDLDGVRVGIATCYDLRFPELFRALVDAGAQWLAVPAAWARGPMKEEHWGVLARARAIENTMWTAAVDAAPGVGLGVGRSLLIDPMGAARIEAGCYPGVSVGEVDFDLAERARRELPSLEHRRL